ncbi:MAG: glycosyltransferase family 39 protein, partial [Planctomycetaceae bacterium]|nr:glycosyltransferase family 39 protein [Planctomycetaceae bacterium]
MNSSNPEMNLTETLLDSPQPLSDDTPLSPPLISRLITLALLLGVGTRVLRYLLRFPLWGDECMLAENFITRTPLGLLQPLDNGQVAPIGFTETLWCMTRLFGFNEWSLRFVSLAAGVAALFAMRCFALRALSPLSALFAIALLASSYYPIRHAAEVKPYALDLFWCIGLLALADTCRRNPGKIRPLVLLALVTPLAQFTSFTATFVAGGICIGLATQALLRKSSSQLLAAVIYGLVLTAAFALLFFLNASSQFSVHAGHMQHYWQNSFPPSPFNQPFQWLIWMLETHTGLMFAYPLGSQSGGSTLTFILVIVGVLRLRQHRDWWFLSTTLGIFGLSYLAGTLHRYPYGDTTRLVQHLAPLICILAGSGIASLIETANAIRWQQTLAKAAFTAMCLIIVGSS